MKQYNNGRIFLELEERLQFIILFIVIWCKTVSGGRDLCADFV